MAIKSQNTLLSIETARGVAKAISGITAARPPVVSAATHGYVSGDIVYIDGVLGMTELNGRAFVVSNETSGTFELKGIDATGYTAYASGGSVYKTTQTNVSEVRSASGFDGQADEIDVTHLRSTAKEFLIGLQDFGAVQFDVFLVTDTGQTALRTAKAAAAAKVFAIKLSNGMVSAFVAYVRQFTFSAEQNGAVAGQVSLRVTGEPAWFA